MDVSIDDLRLFAADLDGETLETIHQRKRFQLQVINEGLQYTAYSGRSRPRFRWV